MLEGCTSYSASTKKGVAELPFLGISLNMPWTDTAPGGSQNTFHVITSFETHNNPVMTTFSK